MSLAACLLFDRRSERALRALWDRIEQQGVPSLRSHTHGRHVPLWARLGRAALVNSATRELFPLPALP